MHSWVAVSPYSCRLIRGVPRLFSLAGEFIYKLFYLVIPTRQFCWCRIYGQFLISKYVSHQRQYLLRLHEVCNYICYITSIIDFQRSKVCRMIWHILSHVYFRIVSCAHVSCHANLIGSGKMSSQSITLMHVTLVFLHLKKFFYQHFQFIDDIFLQASFAKLGCHLPPMPSSSPVQYASDDS